MYLLEWQTWGSRGGRQVRGMPRSQLFQEVFQYLCDRLGWGIWAWRWGRLPCPASSS